MKNTYIVIGVIVVIVLIAAVVFLGSGPSTVAPTATTPTTIQPTTTPAPAPTPITVTLNGLNKSGQSGTATITEVNGKATVAVSLTGEPTGASEPAHLHLGSCTKPGAVKYPLTNVKDGSSEINLTVSMAELIQNLPLSLNVHKSDKELSKYVACGDLTAATP